VVLIGLTLLGHLLLRASQTAKAGDTPAAERGATPRAA
jgi:hypothetical protein